MAERGCDRLVCPCISLHLPLVFFRRSDRRLTRSGSFLPPVSRFHSSNVLFEILPSTRSWANLRRWAWLLKGMDFRMAHLFPSVPAGFHYREDFSNAGEEAALIQEIARMEFATFEMRGIVARRRVFFGRSYDSGLYPCLGSSSKARPAGAGVSWT